MKKKSEKPLRQLSQQELETKIQDLTKKLGEAHDEIQILKTAKDTQSFGSNSNASAVGHVVVSHKGYLFRWLVSEFTSCMCSSAHL